MRIYTLWEEGGERELPWLVAAVDEYTVEDCGWPEKYDEERHATSTGGRVRRELLIEVPDSAVDKLFQTPEVKGKVIEYQQPESQPPKR